MKHKNDKLTYSMVNKDLDQTSHLLQEHSNASIAKKIDHIECTRSYYMYICYVLYRFFIHNF